MVLNQINFNIYFINIKMELSEDYLKTLPADLRRKILFEHLKDPREIFTLCATSKEYKELICEDQKLWRMLLMRDFPEAFYEPSRSGIAIKNYKNSYIRNFLRDETFLRNKAKELLVQGKNRTYLKDQRNLGRKRLTGSSVKEDLNPTEDDVFNEIMNFIQNNKGSNIFTNPYIYMRIEKDLKQKQLKYLKERQLVLDMWRKGESKPGPVVYSKQELSEFF